MYSEKAWFSTIIINAGVFKLRNFSAVLVSYVTAGKSAHVSS